MEREEITIGEIIHSGNYKFSFHAANVLNEALKAGKLSEKDTIPVVNYGVDIPIKGTDTGIRVCDGYLQLYRKGGDGENY